MMLDSATRQRRHVYDLALGFYQLAPWKYMLDSHVFAIVDPKTGSKAYCSVLGNLEEMLGIVFYLGPTGLKCLKELVLTDNEDVDYEEQGFHQDGIICFFPDAEDLMVEEEEELDQVGLEYPEGSQVPLFKRYTPGYMPGLISDEDVAFLSFGLEQAITVCADAAQDPEIASQLGMSKEGNILGRVLGADGKWTYQHVQADSTIDFSPVQVNLSKEEITELNKLQRQDKIWLFEHFYFNMPSYDGLQERAFFPKAIVLMEVENATMVGIEAVTPSEFQEAVGQVIVDAFLTNQYVPQQIVVANRENYILLKSLVKSLGIDLYLDQEMHMVPELREAVMEMFSSEGEVEE